MLVICFLINSIFTVKCMIERLDPALSCVDGAQSNDQRRTGLSACNVSAAWVGAKVKRAFKGVLQHRALLRAAEAGNGGQARATLRHRYGLVVTTQGVVPKGLVDDLAIRRTRAFGDGGSNETR